ncbi:hypothetical protein SZ55_1643 [Pseudomonas sp. FeS53a]|nr:hypothetical protein SZ55_1643 [Pseudomonas sp. FeS53a]
MTNVLWCTRGSGMPLLLVRWRVTRAFATGRHPLWRQYRHKAIQNNKSKNRKCVLKDRGLVVVKGLLQGLSAFI